MQETTIVIGKRAYTNKRAAIKALKQFERRVAKHISKAKERPYYVYED